MNRVEELSLKLADGDLPTAESDELLGLLAQGEEAADSHLQLLEIEACLRARRRDMDLAEAVVSQLKALQTVRLVDGVMAQIKDAGSASVSLQRRTGASLLESVLEKGRWLIPTAKVLPGWRIQAALAVAIAIMVGLGFWLLGPRMGEPVLAGVRGNALTIERGAAVIAGTSGTRLQPGDVLRTGTDDTAAITFSPERTLLALRSGTELRLTSLVGGKRFHLREGRLEATVARQRPLRPMVISTPHAEGRVLGTKFLITVTSNATRLDVAEGRVGLTCTSLTATVKVAAGHYAIAGDGIELNALPKTGVLLREVWTGIPGAEVNDLLYQADYPARPSLRDFVNAFESPEIQTNNVGCRLIGYLHPPITGEYTFWIAASGDAILWFSLEENPTAKVRIATAPGGNARDWDVQPRGAEVYAQKSEPIHLIVGRRYFLQAVQKSANGSSHLSVAWQRPGKEREIIPGEFLSPFKP